MINLIRHNGIDRQLFKDAALLIKPSETLLDVGCGLRPQNMARCKKHICVEPHGEYADALEAAGYEVIRKVGLEGLIAADTIMALDSIEHMEREDGEAFIEKAKDLANQIVIFTPLGFMPDTENGETDAWGCQGQYWQKHRSGWEPGDFPDWTYVISRNFHKKYGAFFAIWNR